MLVLELLDGEPHYELETNEFGEVDNITIVDDGIGECRIEYAAENKIFELLVRF